MKRNGDVESSCFRSSVRILHISVLVLLLGYKCNGILRDRFSVTRQDSSLFSDVN
jgi:hypothetical protein